MRPARGGQWAKAAPCCGVWALALEGAWPAAGAALKRALVPRRELSPLEEASLQNQKLKAAYEARLARLNPNQAVQKTSLASVALGALAREGPLGVCGPNRCWRKAVGAGGVSGGLPRLERGSWEGLFGCG